MGRTAGQLTRRAWLRVPLFSRVRAATYHHRVILDNSDRAQTYKRRTKLFNVSISTRYRPFALIEVSLMPRAAEPQTIPIGTGDAGSAVTRELCEGTDFVMANVHPWHGGLPVEQAAQWTWQFFQVCRLFMRTGEGLTESSASQDFDVKPCEGTGAKMYLAEAGWPTGSDNRTNSNNEGAFPSVPNLQRYLDDFVCQANDNGTEYFYFEFVDALWKKQYGGVEPHWGLLGPDRTLKAVTIPDCEVHRRLRVILSPMLNATRRSLLRLAGRDQALRRLGQVPGWPPARAGPPPRAG